MMGSGLGCESGRQRPILHCNIGIERYRATHKTPMVKGIPRPRWSGRDDFTA
jgi:hypothetical protein